jgi:hypothetical protein
LRHAKQLRNLEQIHEREQVIKDRIKHDFDTNSAIGSPVPEDNPEFVCYLNCALRLKDFIDENSTELTVFSIFSILSFGSIVFSDGFVVLDDETEIYVTFDGISVILWSISGEIFQNPNELVREWRNSNVAKSEEFQREQKRVNDLFAEAGLQFTPGWTGYPDLKKHHS